MYLSRIQLRFNNLRPEMLEKWNSARPYASHQWLWQLFPEQESRQFLFREEAQGGFFMLSAIPPLAQHPLFLVETKPFNPQLTNGVVLDFQLRANPVITRNGKRSDVMMDAKYQAKAKGIVQEGWWELQQQSAQIWLEKQGQQHGFRLLTEVTDDFACGLAQNIAKGRRVVDAYKHINNIVLSVTIRKSRLFSVALILAAHSVLPMPHSLKRLCFLD